MGHAVKSEFLISIVVVTYNCSDVIDQNLKSCIQESGIELIIIDNDSKDETLEIIEPYLVENVKLIKNTKNTGFTFACNQGIKVAKGKYVMLLNPDAYLQTGTISLLANYLEQNSNVGIVAPCLYFPNGRFQNYTRTFPTVGGLCVESFIPRRYWNRFKSYRKYTCQDVDFTKIQEVEQPSGAALMFRNQWLLDDVYFIYGSDVDFCKSVIETGLSIIQIPYAKVIHHQSKGGTESEKLKMYLSLDNYYGMNYYFKKHNQPFTAFIYRILFTILLFARVLLAIFERKNNLSMRWLKFIYFLQNKNFRAYLETIQ